MDDCIHDPAEENARAEQLASRDDRAVRLGYILQVVSGKALKGICMCLCMSCTYMCMRVLCVYAYVSNVLTLLGLKLQRR